MFEQAGFEVRFEWGPKAISTIGPSVDAIVIVDVLSFSTSVDIAVSRGAEVLPYYFNHLQASEFATVHHAVLADREAKPGSYSLRPTSLLAIPSGTRLVLPSPNGSALSFQAAESGQKVFAGCLRNAKAIGTMINRHGWSTLVVAAGERWPDNSLRPCYEDLVGAGAIIDHLSPNRSPEAEAALVTYLESINCLEARVFACSSGQELTARGSKNDVKLATRLNESDSVPLLDGSAFVRWDSLFLG